MLYVQFAFIVQSDTVVDDGRLACRKTGLTPPPFLPVINTGHSKAVLPLLFHLFYFGAVKFLNVLISTLLCCFQLFNLVKVTELQPVWERATCTNSAYHLLFCCLLRHVVLSL